MLTGGEFALGSAVPIEATEKVDGINMLDKFSKYILCKKNNENI